MCDVQRWLNRCTSHNDGQAIVKPTKPKNATEDVLSHLSQIVHQRSYQGAEVHPKNQRTVTKTLDNILAGKPEYVKKEEFNYDVEVSEQDIINLYAKTNKSKDVGVIERCYGPCCDEDASTAQDTAIKCTKTGKRKHIIVGEKCHDPCNIEDTVQDTVINDTKTVKTKHEGVVETCCDLCNNDDTAQKEGTREHDAEKTVENEPQFYEDINKTLAEVVKKRVETEAKASRLNKLKNKYNNQAINLLEEEYRELCRLREIQLRASSTREAPVEGKKASKLRRIRSILRRDEFVTRSENRDKTFEEKKRREEKKDRERLLKAVNKPMPPSKFSKRVQAILSFVGSSLLLAGIMGLLYKYINMSGMKTAVENVFKAIVDGSGSSKKAQGAWSFGTFDPHGRPRDIGPTGLKINEEMLKFPDTKPPMEFTIPGFHCTDEDDEGDFNLGGDLDFEDDD